MVWSHTVPGPVRRVWKSPSPPRNLFFRPGTCWMSMETPTWKPATLPVSTKSCSPGPRVYSISSPSISAKAVPWPERRCMMKPSPPKKPAPSFLLKWMSSATPDSAARKDRFWRMNSCPGPMVRGRILPGKLEPKVIMAPSRWAV